VWEGGVCRDLVAGWSVLCLAAVQVTDLVEQGLNLTSSNAQGSAAAVGQDSRALRMTWGGGASGRGRGACDACVCLGGG